VAQLANSVDPADAVTRLKPALAQIPNVLAKPEPDVEILTFTERGPVLAVRPYCNNAHYWQSISTPRGDPNDLRGRRLSGPGAHIVRRAV